jgi:hydrogenase nickel incorporation protein HypA/HybF
MHEIGYCEAVLDAVERRAEGRRVVRLGVRVGALHRIVPAAFEQSFQLVAAGGVADRASTEVTIIASRAGLPRLRGPVRDGRREPGLPRVRGARRDRRGR